MSRYRIGRPQNDVRLRNWDSGRLAQLRLAVSRLETELNSTLGAAVDQSTRRATSDQVPFILDLSVAPGYRQLQIDFSPPPGLGGHPLRQLLFYEIQHDDNAGFSNPTVINTPQTHIVIGGLGLGETRFVRARVVSTRNAASPWTSTITATTAQGQIIQTAITPVNGYRLTASIGEFRDIFSQTYTSAGGAVSINVHIGLATPAFNVDKTLIPAPSNLSESFRGGPACVQFRWRYGVFNDVIEDFITTGTGERTLLAARPGYSESTDPNGDQEKTPFAYGTFMSPFIRPPSGVEVKFTLQAALVPGSEWKGPESADALAVSTPLLFTGNGKVIEVIEEF